VLRDAPCTTREASLRRGEAAAVLSRPDPPPRSQGALFRASLRSQSVLAFARLHRVLGAGFGPIWESTLPTQGEGSRLWADQGVNPAYTGCKEQAFGRPGPPLAARESTLPAQAGYASNPACTGRVRIKPCLHRVLGAGFRPPRPARGRKGVNPAYTGRVRIETPARPWPRLRAAYLGC
jgi:hypothetical protein